MGSLYSCDCPDCSPSRTSQTLAADDTLLGLAKKAYNQIFRHGYKVEELKTNKHFKALSKAIQNRLNRGLIEGISDNDIPGKMRTALDEDVYIFSQLKTHAQLFEASRLLTHPDGNIRSFSSFKQEYTKLNELHNVNYLEAEYEFAISSAQSAANWADIEANNDRYDLQYRTAKDERVRESHRVLDGITLPSTDDFWNYFFAPNGWRCRCNVASVLKGKFTLSDPKTAMQNGEQATTQLNKSGQNTLAIFRFNAGKQKVIFPPHHPYRKIQDANKVIND